MIQTSVLFTKRCLGDASVCKQLNDYLAEHPGYEVALTNFFSDPHGCSETLFVVFNLPAESLKPAVVQSQWKYFRKQNAAVCLNCSFERDLDANFGAAVACPNCGALMK